MLIVALQDDIDNLYAIWDTVVDRFLGVNLKKYEAFKIIYEHKHNYTLKDAIERVEYPQSFADIAKYLCNEIDECEKVKEENAELKNIIDNKLGSWIDYCKKHGSNTLTFDLLCEMFEMSISYDKLMTQLSTLFTRCHDSVRNDFALGNYGALHIVSADELKTKGKLK